jgi:crotonobetainyl-CoA:carnitine CoA-transferase CaiB-like acyl-CoA transferase
MVGHGDGLAGFMLASGICAALLHRERTGVAQVVDASLLGSAMWVLGPVLASAQFEDSVVALTPRESMGPGMIAYRTKDNRFVQLVMLGGRADFRDLCEHLGHPELEADPRFADVQFSPADVGTSRAEAVRVLDEIFAQRTLAEWRTALATMRGVWAPVQTMAELYEDSQTLANGFIQEVPGEPDGLKLPVPPVLFDGEGGAPPRAPDFGEHTDQILAEVGYDDAEIEAMRTAGVI